MPDSFTDRLRQAVSLLAKGPKSPLRRTPLPGLTEVEIQELKAFFPMDKYFILGHARSGTTLLARLIRLHPQVHCNWQAHFFTRPPQLQSLVSSADAEKWLAARRSNRWNHGRDLSPVVMRAAADFIMEREARREGKTIVGDKSPNTAVHGKVVRDMHGIYPDAAIIYIVRDGRDVIISQRFRNFVEEKDLAAEDLRILQSLRRDPAPFTDGTRSIFSEAFIRHDAQSWVDDMTEVVAEGRRLYGDRFIDIRYEDLLTRPYEVMCRLWEFLGVAVDGGLAKAVEAEMETNPDEEWQAQRNDSIAAFLPKGQPGNWQRLFTERDKTLFKSIAGETLVRWEYEKNMDW
jgi:LPS sulfotransferase NodH